VKERKTKGIRVNQDLFHSGRLNLFHSGRLKGMYLTK